LFLAKKLLCLDFTQLLIIQTSDYRAVLRSTSSEATSIFFSIKKKQFSMQEDGFNRNRTAGQVQSRDHNTKRETRPLFVPKQNRRAAVWRSNLRLASRALEMQSGSNRLRCVSTYMMYVLWTLTCYLRKLPLLMLLPYLANSKIRLTNARDGYQVTGLCSTCRMAC
jgi:hypothetical protein